MSATTDRVPDPDQTREAARAKRRRDMQERFERLADCRISRDPAVVAAFHDKLAESGLRDCGACGVRFADPGRPFTAAEVPAVVQYVASAKDDAGAASVRLQSLRGFLHPRLAFSVGTALMGALLLATGFPVYALVYLGMSLLGLAVVAILKWAGL